jgi:hypothetical protein
VAACCFAYAERLSDTLGHDQAQGVWGGLTQRERDTLAILDRPPELCPSCGLLCVPVGSTTELCNVCNPKPTINWVEYRPLVEPLIAAGRTYQQVADELRLDKVGVSSACYRWNLQLRTPGKRGRRAVKGCGTLAAKTRHRRHGENWRLCACAQVPWKPKRTPKRRGEGNVD